MRRSARLSRVFAAGLLLFIVLSLPHSLVAQIQLTETYTSSDGTLTMNYPEGWEVTERDDGLITFIGPDRVSLQIAVNDYPADTTPTDLLTAGDFGFSEAEGAILAGYAALLSRSSDQMHVVINLCDGPMAIVFAFTSSGQVAANELTFRAMLDSLQYGDSAPRICRGSFEGFAAISAANSATVGPVGTIGDESLAVNAVAISPDNRLLAIGSSDRAVRIFNLVTGQEEEPLGSHAGGATSIAFDRGGRTLATGSGIGVVQGWDVDSSEALLPMQRHAGAVESIAYSPVDLTAVSGGADGSVRVYDRGAGDEQAPLDDDADTTPVTSVTYSPDGTMVAAAAGASVRLWNFPAGTVRSTLDSEVSEIAAIAFSPDGSRLVYGGTGDAAWIWDLASGNQPLFAGHNGPVTAVAYSPDGRLIASGDQTAVHLWDAASGERLATYETSTGQPVTSVVFSPNGTVLAVGGAGPVVLLATTEAGGAAVDTPASTSEPATTATVEGTSATTATCSVSAPGTANLRAGPGTSFDRAGSLAAGQSIEIDAQTTGDDGFVWYRLTNGAWVRSDVIGSPAACAGVPSATP
jgi:WD40 repeat protein